MIANSAINNPKISFQSLGLLTYLLSKPPHWEVNVLQIISERIEGKCAIYGMIKELITAGYIHRIITHDGKFRGVDYDVYEDPNQNPDYQLSGFLEVDNRQHSNNSIEVNTVFSNNTHTKPVIKIDLNKKVHDFYLKVRDYQLKNPTKYPAGLYEKFIKYWTEPDKKGTRIRYDGEQFFDISKRMSTFKSNTNPQELNQMWVDHNKAMQTKSPELFNK